MEGRNEKAILLLQRYLKTWTDDAMHTKLAQILAATDKLGESLSHYQTALSINAANDAAKKGLERLEKQTKCVDPDAVEEEEDNEGEVQTQMQRKVNSCSRRQEFRLQPTKFLHFFLHVVGCTIYITWFRFHLRADYTHSFISCTEVSQMPTSGVLTVLSLLQILQCISSWRRLSSFHGCFQVFS